MASGTSDRYNLLVILIFIVLPHTGNPAAIYHICDRISIQILRKSASKYDAAIVFLINYKRMHRNGCHVPVHYKSKDRTSGDGLGTSCECINTSILHRGFFGMPGWLLGKYVYLEPLKVG